MWHVANSDTDYMPVKLSMFMHTWTDEGSISVNNQVMNNSEKLHLDMFCFTEIKFRDYSYHVNYEYWLETLHLLMYCDDNATAWMTWVLITVCSSAKQVRLVVNWWKNFKYGPNWLLYATADLKNNKKKKLCTKPVNLWYCVSQAMTWLLAQDTKISRSNKWAAGSITCILCQHMIASLPGVEYWGNCWPNCLPYLLHRRSYFKKLCPSVVGIRNYAQRT